MKTLGLKMNVCAPIPEDGIEKVVEIMRCGSLYRYSCTTAEESDVAILEKQLSNIFNRKYVLCLNSCGSALYLALLGLGVKKGDQVLMNAFTYIAVPSAIINANAVPKLVEINDMCQIDCDDLAKKITTNTKFLLVSHMRGHVSDMKTIEDMCKHYKLKLIVDCAHSFEGTFEDAKTAKHGDVACLSTQSHKMINSGEGGVLLTDKKTLMANAMYLSGCQESFYSKHYDINAQDIVNIYEKTPNYSLRMQNITAAIVKSQIPLIQERLNRYNGNYMALENILGQSEYIKVIQDDERVSRAKDSIQFRVVNKSQEKVRGAIDYMQKKGIVVDLIGREGNPRYYRNWKFMDSESLAKTDSILRQLCDLRLPLSLDLSEIEFIGETIIAGLRKN